MSSGRLIGRDHAFDLRTEFLFVSGVGHLHEHLQLSEKNIRIEPDRAADVDQLVRRCAQALLRHQLFFIQLLAGAQARILDFDIHVGAQTRELDQISRKRVDLYGGAHVEHEDLPALRIDSRLQDKRGSFRDRHEVANDIGVRDRHRAALCDLLLKARHDRAVAAEDIAEAHGHKLGFRIFGGLHDLAHTAALVAAVHVKRRQLVRLAVADLAAERLNDHLAQALGRAHDVRGVHRLVGRDQNKALAAV